MKRLWLPSLALAAGLLVLSLGFSASARQNRLHEIPAIQVTPDCQADLQESEDTKLNKNGKAIATFGGGCFWCVEAVFQELKGVHSVKSGYMGGHTKNPTYEDICTGKTGHAEVIRIEYDPDEISFEKLLQVHWATHDPTTLNRQGWDVGTQYRSAIFYHDETQKQLAEKLKQKIDEARVYRNPLVTEITAASKFHEAEDYHQDYFRNNPNVPYCDANIPPKLEKLRKLFAEDVRQSADK